MLNMMQMQWKCSKLSKFWLTITGKKFSNFYRFHETIGKKRCWKAVFCVDSIVHSFFYAYRFASADSFSMVNDVLKRFFSHLFWYEMCVEMRNSNPRRCKNVKRCKSQAIRQHFNFYCVQKGWNSYQFVTDTLRFPYNLLWTCCAWVCAECVCKRLWVVSIGAYDRKISYFTFISER